MMQSRKMLLLSHQFPPAKGVGTLRASQWARHLPHHGWEPVVLSARGSRDEPVEGGDPVPPVTLVRAPELTHPFAAWRIMKRLLWRLRGRDWSLAQRVWVPPLLRADIGPGAAARAALVGLATLPDGHAGWLPGALLAGLRLVRQTRPEVIVSTAPPWTCALLGLMLHRLTGVPWMCDLRDPWVSGHEGTAQARPGPAGRVARWLEARVVEQADRITVTNEHYAEVLRKRYPGLRSPGTVVAIPNGFEPEDFEAAEARPRSADCFRIVYGGTIYRWQRLDSLLEVLAELIETGLMDRQRVRLEVFGERLGHQSEIPHEEQVKRLGLEEVVRFPGSLPHRAMLAEFRAADLLLLLGPPPLQVPAKTFEYLASGRPILAVMDEEGATADLLRGFARAVRVTPEDREGLRRALLAAYGRSPAGRLAAVAPASRSPRRSEDGGVDAASDGARSVEQLGSGPAEPSLVSLTASARVSEVAKVLDALMRPMPVLHLIHSLERGGAETSIVALCRQVDRRRFRLTVCCLDGKGELASELEQDGIRVLALERRPGLRFGTLFGLVALLRRERPQILRMHGWPATFWGRMAAPLAGVPRQICSEHGGEKQRSWRHQLADRVLALGTDRIVAVSADLAARCQRIGIAPHRLEVVPNGIDVTGLGQRADRRRARALLEIPLDLPVIGIVARLHPVKQHRLFLEAVALAQRQLPELLALVIGDGALRAELEDVAAQLGLGTSVRWLGVRRDVPDLLGALDVLVSASREEGCPISALEAMAAGVPVLAPRIPAFEEISAGGTAVMLVEPGSEHALSDGIVRLLGDQQMRRRLAAAAHQYVCEHHDIRRTAARYERLYDEVGRC